MCKLEGTVTTDAVVAGRESEGEASRKKQTRHDEQVHFGRQNTRKRWLYPFMLLQVF